MPYIRGMRDATLVQRLREVRERIAVAERRAGREPGSVHLMAAVKTRTPEEIAAVVAAGVTFLGENRVQEGEEHLAALPADLRARCRAHFIGQLQGNKVRKALLAFDSLDSVDSEELADRIDRIAGEEERRAEVMLEVNVGEEAQKGGAPPEQALALARSVFARPRLTLTGLMAVPPLEENPEASRPHFRAMARLFQYLRSEHPRPELFRHLSMGMSHDYEIAVEEGATLVRVGSALFGPRSPR